MQVKALEIYQILPTIFLFDSLTGEQLKSVVSFTSIKRLNKGEQLFAEEEFASAFFAIISGKLKIYQVSPEGMEHTLEIHASGDLVAEAAIFDRETYPAYCSALEDTVLLRIPKQEFLGLMRTQPEVAVKIMHSYSKHLRRLVAMVAELSLHSIKSRLARYIFQNCIRENQKMVCRMTISKKELASALGTIPETLSRTLKYFKTEGIIAEEKHRITVLDVKKLKALI